jgi:metal transporter CNNM
MMSGLTIGLLSLDYVSLQVLKNSGEPQERIYAARIIPLVRHKHLLLVTLLLCNAAAMEALPIFLDKMVPSYLAIALSVTAVLFFGECVVQAVPYWGRVWQKLSITGRSCGTSHS